MKAKRLMAMLLCLLTIIGIIPGVASAAPSTVTIESQTNSAFDYLEYQSSDGWKDLNTPRHWIEQTGETVYCIEHSADNPHGDTYTAASPSSVFSGSTLAGLNSILMYGYPNNKPSGFTDDEARQATANAIRFWLSEQGEDHTYSFTNRATNPGSVRAKSGYEHVLEWADELLAKARARQEMPHSISFSPSSVTLTQSGGGFSGQTAVKLTNINSGYTLNTSGLPAGASVTGYTGSRTETLTITVSSTAAGQSFSLSATGKDTRSVNNITAYVPSNGSLQKVFLCATTAQVVATANLSVETPAFGKIKIVKNGEGGEKLSGVKLGIFTDSACKNKIAELTTGADGTVTSGDLPAGTVYVKELSTISPYILSGSAQTVAIPVNQTATATFSNVKAMGRIRIEKNGEQLAGFETKETDYGTLHIPRYEKRGLQGVVYEIRDTNGKLIETVTTNSAGVAESGKLPLGGYSVQEKSTKSGFVLDKTVHEVTLSYKDQTTAIVTQTVSAENQRQKGAISLKKLSEQFNESDCTFEQINGEGFVIGLYTKSTVGTIPANALVDILITDEDGNAQTSADLPLNAEYYLKELVVPQENIKLSAATYPVKLEAANDTAESFTNSEYVEAPIENEQYKGKIKVIKVDADDHDRNLSGAVFDVKNEAGKVLCSITTTEKGGESPLLPVGKYQVSERVQPTGFKFTDEVWDVEITKDSESVITLTVENEATEVTLKKSDITDGKPVPGATIEIYGENGKLYHKAQTDASGEIYMREIPAGKYTWKETICPDGYALNTETFSFEVDKYGKVTGTTEMVDEPITLTITKMNTYTKQPFAGISFTLKDSEGNTVKTKLTDKGYRVAAEDGEETFAVDNKGYAEFRYLKAGKYTLIEDTPLGYIAEDEIAIELTTAHSLSKPNALTVNNTPTGVKIIKVEAKTNKPLTGAGFRVKIKDGLGFETLTFTRMEDGSYFFDEDGKVMDLMVNSKGEITILGLPLGAVWIEESIVPEGYFPIAARKAEITKETSLDKPLTIKVENSKFVKLGLDSDWWEFPALIGACLLACGGAVFFFIRRKKKIRKSEG